jgi:hypothetical protein
MLRLEPGACEGWVTLLLLRPALSRRHLFLGERSLSDQALDIRSPNEDLADAGELNDGQLAHDLLGDPASDAQLAL